jgi:hypothetical protein
VGSEPSGGRDDATLAALARPSCPGTGDLGRSTVFDNCGAWVERRTREPSKSASNPVVQVRDTVGFEHTGALQLDVLGSEVVEETAPLAEEHRDEMDLELVEDARRERELRRPGAVDEHVPAARVRLASFIAVVTSAT